MTSPHALLIALSIAGCSGGDPADTGAGADFGVVDRQPGERAPLTAECDDQDTFRCVLPFPSSTFMVADPTTPTGVRVAVTDSILPGGEDDATFMNSADGFSRITPISTGFSARLDTAWLDALPRAATLAEDAPVQLINAQPGHPLYGQRVPIWAEFVEGGRTDKDHLLIAYPQVPMAAGADHVVVLTRDLTHADGSDVEVSRWTDLVTGLATPTDKAEAALAAYHAPTRAVLDAAGIAPSEVLRAWDFTARSDENMTGRLDGMMDVIRQSGGFGVEIDYAAETSEEDIDLVILGRLTGVPWFLDDEDRFVLDDAGVPQLTGEGEVKFRVVLPTRGYDGEVGSPYRIALYGHGTGGNISDDAFDEEIAREGIAKVSLEFGAWNGDDLIWTFQRFLRMNAGVEQSTAMLLHSVVGGYAILQSLDAGLGEALRADTIGGLPNPHPGRDIITDDPMWVGGSLGGTMGAIIGTAYPEIDKAVLNVPAGAWTHLIPDSYMYDFAMRPVLEGQFGDAIDARLSIALTQTGWDDVDGPVWADRALASGVSFLLQESMGDPVVPNQGTTVLATALKAKMVGPALDPIVGLEEVDSVVDGVGITQYRVPGTEVYAIHGFAARETPAGAAAMEQIFTFVRAGWDEGATRVEFPAGCADVTPDGSCDFSDVWVED
jgi:hypothetical protein